MRVYICPICGRSLMPNDKLKYKQPTGGQPIPCLNHAYYIHGGVDYPKMVLPLATPVEI